MASAVAVQLLPLVICITTVGINMCSATKVAWFAAILGVGLLVHGVGLLLRSLAGRLAVGAVAPVDGSEPAADESVGAASVAK